MLLKKTKKEYFGNLNEKNVCDNKTFWKTVKPFLSDKIVSKEQITLVENNENISEDRDVAQTLNSFFSNIATNLKIPAYADSNSNLENISNPIIKLILKYRDHPSILTVGEVYKEKSDSPFLFTGIHNEEILKEIWIHQRHVKILTFPQKFSRKMQIDLQIFYTRALMNL